MQFTDVFRAMDTDVEVLVDAPFPPMGAFISVKLLFEQQEERFSRCRPTSLLSRLNGGDVVEDPLFAQACELALHAHDITQGLFNPMVLPALAEAGYAGTFSSVAGGEPRRQEVPDPRECLEVEGTRVRLRGGQLDLGGIVKGWTVDRAVEMQAMDLPNVFVSAGGDLRCAGSEEGVDGWVASIERPQGGPDAWEGAVHGALATSTTTKRRWRTTSGGHAHHLVDPRTGVPAEARFVQASAWAPETWRAEVWAKAVIVGGEEAAAAALEAGVPSLAIDAAGMVFTYGSP